MITTVARQTLLRQEIEQIERLMWTLACQVKCARELLDACTAELEDARLN